MEVRRIPRIPFHSLTLFTQSSVLSNFFISDVMRARRTFLFLVLPFVFISSSRGTLTATCRVCDHVFLSCTLSSLLLHLLHSVSGRHYAAYPSSRGSDARTARETRPEKVFFLSGMCDATVGCVWRHACHTLRPLWLYYIFRRSPPRDSHLLFTPVLHLMSFLVVLFSRKMLFVKL